MVVLMLLVKYLDKRVFKCISDYTYVHLQCDKVNGVISERIVFSMSKSVAGNLHIDVGVS